MFDWPILIFLATLFFGCANGQTRCNMIRKILLAWLLILPAAALLSAGTYSVLRRL